MLILLLLTLTGCDPYTPEEHALIDPIRQQFYGTCEEYLAIRPEYEERRYNDCNDRDFSELGGPASYQACQDEYAAYLAKADELEGKLYAAVGERNALGFASWMDREWICHTGHHSRD